MNDTPFYNPDTIDLTNCDREPIHLLGRVQDFGALIAVSSDWIVQHASDNVSDLLGLTVDDMLGTPLSDHLSSEVISTIRSRLQIADQTANLGRIFDLAVLGDHRRFDLAVHRSERSIVIELEPRQTRHEDRIDLVHSLMSRVRRHSDFDSFLAEGARCLSTLSGFDRVMVYRFHPDDTGEVAAEAITRDGIEPFLGLRYPATDIPVQARRLYVRNPIRIISDVNAPVHLVRPGIDPSGRPLDLSMAVTRAVSPIHLEYLRNMGVSASMSVSILRRGRLWGLFACHHYDPRVLEFELRTACEMFGELFSYELSQRLDAEELAQSERARDLHDRIMASASSTEGLMTDFPVLAEDIRRVLPCDGIAIWSEGNFRAIGATPTAEEFLGLARFLNTAAPSTVFSTDEIARIYPRAETFADRAAGLLALPISRTPRDYIVLFRRELRQTVTWAGRPQDAKQVEHGPNGPRLTPRKSFEAWQDTVLGRSAHWTVAETRAAEALRVTLLEVVLKLNDEAMQARKKAQEQQDLLISELNHRVRNVLNLIQGLVNQSRAGARDVDTFATTINGRIQALARAHDQLNRNTWTPSSLYDLIGTEIRAYLGPDAASIAITGPDALLVPEAFSTLALVVHELMTNSVKYGALSDSHGHVDCAIEVDPDGTLTFGWTETGGPAVRKPARRGFGSSLIERAIPHELGGSAEVFWRLEGLGAVFTLPPRWFEAIDPPAEASTPAPDTAPAEAPRLSGTALVVEDNAIIAMEAMELLQDMGADKVVMAPRVAEAIRQMEGGKIDFALFDLNLGTEMSLPAVTEAVRRGIPCILATGYGESDSVRDQAPGVPVLTKPYDGTTLARAVERALGAA